MAPAHAAACQWKECLHLRTDFAAELPRRAGPEKKPYQPAHFAPVDRRSGRGDFPVVWLVSAARLCGPVPSEPAPGAPAARPRDSADSTAAMRCGDQMTHHLGYCLHSVASLFRSSPGAAGQRCSAARAGVVCSPAGWQAAVPGEQVARTAERVSLLSVAGYYGAVQRGTGSNCANHMRACFRAPAWCLAAGCAHSAQRRRSFSLRPDAVRRAAAWQALAAVLVAQAAGLISSSWRSSKLAAELLRHGGSGRTGQSPPAAELSLAGAKFPEFYWKVCQT